MNVRENKIRSHLINKWHDLIGTYVTYPVFFHARVRYLHVRKQNHLAIFLGGNMYTSMNTIRVGGCVCSHARA